LPSVFGAFLIGLILRRLRFSEQAIAEITPFRDVFVAIFFVSLGMLLNFKYVFQEWQTLAIMVPLIIAVNFGIVFLITWRFGYGKRVAIMTGAAMFHIGEFGFIIAQSGLGSGLISSEQYSLLIASAIITMLLMPVSMGLASRATRRFGAMVDKKAHGPAIAEAPAVHTAGSIILAGYGRVGSNVAEGLKSAGLNFTVIELDPENLSLLRKKGYHYIYGDCTNGLILSHAGLAQAKTLVITYPDQQAVERTIANALQINPGLNIIARTNRLRDAALLRGPGIKALISPEYQASQEFLKRTLTLAGMEGIEIEKLVHDVYKEDLIAEVEKRSRS